MADDRSRNRRKLVTPYAAAAWQTGDVDARASLLEMAQRWRNPAGEKSNPPCRGALDETLYDRVIQRGIGRQLRTEFAVRKHLPHRLLALLMQLNEQPDAGLASDDQYPPAAPRANRRPTDK
jgi:hypothetical protein